MEAWRKQLIFLRGAADALCLEDFSRALQIIDTLHVGQVRNDGAPFYSHPLRVAGHAYALGFRQDWILAGGVLHDVVEDTTYTLSDLKEMGFSGDTLDTVDRLSRRDQETVSSYFGRIAERNSAILLKILDRLHNFTTMIGVFKRERALRFIDETIDYVYPLFDVLKKRWPAKQQELYQVKYMLESLVEAAKIHYHYGEEVES